MYMYTQPEHYSLMILDLIPPYIHNLYSGYSVVWANTVAQIYCVLCIYNILYVHIMVDRMYGWNNLMC